MEKGIKGFAETKSDEENTAAAMGSGNLEVFATPSMVALMEEAAAKSVQPFIGEDESTVGTLINVKHLSATPIGMSIHAESVLEEADGKRLIFSVKAFDDTGLIGEGTHERFIIDIHRFMKKTDGKFKK